MSAIVDGHTEAPWIIKLRIGEGYSKSYEYNPSGDGTTFTDWPAGTTGYITLTYTAPGNTTPTFTGQWDAVVTGTLMTFTEANTITDLVPDGTEIVLWMNINGGAGNEPVASGTFVRKG